MSYPHFPTSRPNLFRLLPPGQNVLDRARKAGVDTRSSAEVKAWRRAGEPTSWSR